MPRILGPENGLPTLLVDNDDSFTMNLAHAFAAAGARVRVTEARLLPWEDLRGVRAIVLSPGPGTPEDARENLNLLQRISIPVLGVCLGMQVIALFSGAAVVRAEEPMHGDTSPIEHSGEGIFRGLPKPFSAARYHSLAVERATLPPELRVIAQAKQKDARPGEIMAIAHATRPLVGVQFHPESFLTPWGPALLRNWLGEIATFWEEPPPHR